MGSSLTYGGVTLAMTKTNLYAQEPVYSPDGSDYLGTRVTLDVDAIYNPGCSGATGPVTDLAIRSTLMAPRSTLIYRIGNTVVLQSPADGFGVDVQNGPNPRSCTVRQITERTWRVAYRVETMINECPPLSNGLTSNRWQQTHAIGPDNLTTLITRGLSIFRTDTLSALGQNADAFRANCLPLVPLHFQRRSLVVRVSEVGNALTWECVDQERFVSLGATLNAQRYGVIDFNAVHSIASIPAGSGGVASTSTMHTIQVQVRGDRTASRAGLLTWAVKLGIEKLGLPAPGQPVKPKDQVILTNVLLSEQIEAPVVNVAISGRRAPAAVAGQGVGPARLEFLGIDTSSLFDANGYNPQKPGGVRGTYFGEAFAATLRTACSAPQVTTSVVQGATSNPDLALGNSQSIVDIGVGPPLDTGGTKYSPETTDEGVVTEAKVDIKWERNEAKLACSVAGDENEAPVELVLGNPLVYRVVDWTMERAHAKPPVPTPYSNDLSERLVGTSSITVAAPEIAPDGVTPIYRVSGHSTYLRTDNRGPGDDGLYMGAVPWATLAYLDESNVIRASDYKHGIADPGQTTA